MSLPSNTPPPVNAGGGFNHHEALEDQTQFWYETPTGGIPLPFLTGRSKAEAAQILLRTASDATAIREAYPSEAAEMLILLSPPEIVQPADSVLFCWYKDRLFYYEHRVWKERLNKT